MLAEHDCEYKDVIINRDKCTPRLLGCKRHVMTYFIQHFLNEVWWDVLSLH